MLTLKGKLINTFVSPKGEKDGKEYGGQDKVQIIGDVLLPNGETKVDMFTLTTSDAAQFESHIDKMIRVPIGVFAAARAVTYYIPKGSSLELC